MLEISQKTIMGCFSCYKPRNVKKIRAAKIKQYETELENPNIDPHRKVTLQRKVEYLKRLQNSNEDG